MYRVKVPLRILPLIVFSQFAGTSLWFAGNAVLKGLAEESDIPESSLPDIVSAVQFGFITGTLFFAFFNISDRFSPRLLFFLCSALGALANLLVCFMPVSLYTLLLLRFITGFLLAGIYPVGMRIAASWYDKGLGNAIGWLVGSLVLGTAFPYLLSALGGTENWRSILTAVSLLAFTGGLVMVPGGPHLGKSSSFNPRALSRIFKNPDFRSSAFGYFGHMWELYTFWAFVPLFLNAYKAYNPDADINTTIWSFIVISSGALGCAGGGRISLKAGSARVAFVCLLCSGISCLLSPLMFHTPPAVFLTFLVFWGITVAGDSPQFSTLTAGFAPRDLVGTALTFVVCIGFAITVPSIKLTGYLISGMDERYIFLPLAAGPVLGLMGFYRLIGKRRS